MGKRALGKRALGKRALGKRALGKRALGKRALGIGHWQRIGNGCSGWWQTAIAGYKTTKPQMAIRLTICPIAIAYNRIGNGAIAIAKHWV
ncbi:MAG: hypothetical protein F6J93_12130 [Oscillatoria sp. SIO1A7]|nr:hypothetical protein [Oscillatoria sp. SIO1A7]